MLSSSEIFPNRGMNLLAGKNGVGKTSFIEALFVLGRGQSFRHREIRPWIREGEKTARLFAESVDQRGEHRIGFEQSRSGRVIRIDGKDIDRRSDLVRALPLQLVTPSSHELIEKGPNVRRRFLDWGLFHVEHEFHRQSLVFKRLLSQRNAALKNHDHSFTAWDKSLSDAIDRVEILRLGFLPILTDRINDELRILKQPYLIETALRSNWDLKDGALPAITENRYGDQKRGFTRVGPHRSHIEIFVDKVPAERRLSRGQQKALVYAMIIGLSQIIAEKSSEIPMVLIDDLPAELDINNRIAVIDRLTKIGAQSFVSGIEFDQEAISRAGKVFHVEHGSLLETR